MDPIVFAIIFSAVLLVAMTLAISAVKNLMYICEPNEVIVFTGRRSVSEGRAIGYTTLKVGRRLRIPFIEEATRLDVSTMTVDIRVTNAYSKGNIPLNVHAIANVKVDIADPVLENAIERFLGRNREEIRRVAKETIEGALRGVLARLTPEQVNEDRLKFVQTLSEDAEDDLRKIGLKLDTLKIQSVSDEENYLDSIGRARIAEALRDAEVAESDNRRDADKAAADAEGRGRVAQEQATATVAAKRNELRRIVADLDAEARASEERTTAAEAEARARAEIALQEVRTELERLRLQADEILPADASRRANEFLAQGDTAHIAAEGRATAEALGLISEAWTQAGPDADQLFVLQRIESILERVIAKLGDVSIEHVNLVDSGDGASLGKLAGAYPGMINAVLDSVGHTIGVDIRDLLSKPATPETLELARRRRAGDGPTKRDARRPSVLDVVSEREQAIGQQMLDARVPATPRNMSTQSSTPRSAEPPSRLESTAPVQATSSEQPYDPYSGPLRPQVSSLISPASEPLSESYVEVTEEAEASAPVRK